MVYLNHLEKLRKSWASKCKRFMACFIYETLRKNNKRGIIVVLYDYKDLIKLYELYGFKLHENNSDYITFIYDQGYFKNAEIIKFRSCNLQQYIEDLRKVGFAAYETEFQGINGIHEKLFNGFFKVDYYTKKIKLEYEKFKHTQKRINGIDYQYIKGSYFKGVELKFNDIVEDILLEIKKEGPSLIILEAAAGYGKTCTVNEIYNELSIEFHNNKIPLMSELSRNRKAKIFKYILLDEIDRKFAGLSTEIVVEEIVSGRIPLIVDGFDELLIRSHSTNNEDISDEFDDVESMLSTIGELLRGNAKIILTSRKSAILSGDQFYDWVNNVANDFQVLNYTLNEPSIRDWIGSEKMEVISDFGENARNLLSPVMLAFLRNMSIEELQNKSTDDLVVLYFNKLLNRERERQNIKLHIEDQINIFMSLSLEMANNGITSDSRENIKNIILSKHWGLLEESRDLYDPTDKPDIESIANSLAGHVLLDRNGELDQVGFINEFVFGLLLGDSICKYNFNDLIDYQYIDMVCTAYEIRGLNRRVELFDNLHNISNALLDYEKLEVDRKLNNKLSFDYKGLSVTNITFNRFVFDNYIIKESVFYSCIFKDLTFNKNVFESTSFIDCKFYNCTFNDQEALNDNIYFINCISDNEDLNMFNEIIQDVTSESSELDLILKYEKVVIEQFWPAGKERAQRKRAYRTLFYGIDHADHEYVEKAINSLKKKGIITVFSDIHMLNYSKLNEIQQIKGLGDSIYG